MPPPGESSRPYDSEAELLEIGGDAPGSSEEDVPRLPSGERIIDLAAAFAAAWPPGEWRREMRRRFPDHVLPAHGAADDIDDVSSSPPSTIQRAPADVIDAASYSSEDTWDVRMQWNMPMDLDDE